MLHSHRYVLRRNSLSFEVVRDVLRALMACDLDFQTNLWGRCQDSPKIAAISALLNATTEATVRDLNAIRVPTVAELQQYWFKDPLHTSGIAQSILATAQFLVALRGGQGGLPSPAVNRSYMDAAILYPKEVDIDKIIETSTRKAGLQTSLSTSLAT